jgi:uncharacterized membrane protein YhaH (DUF805 family)
MDWKTLFFKADGRISRQSFWIAVLILFGANVLLGWIPLIGLIISLVGLYAGVCVYSKRLHDMGKSGWLQLAPMIAVFVLMGVAMMSLGGMSAMGAFSGRDDMMAGAAMGGFGLMALLAGLAMLIGIGFLLWVGLTPGEPGPNKYGDPPAPSPLPGPPKADAPQG